MFRTVAILAVVISLGCKSTDDRPAPPPLPEGDVSLGYSDLYLRLRQIAWRANESFYRDQWTELEDSSKELVKAARLLRQASDVPAHLTAVIKEKTESLSTEAEKLKVTASEKNAGKTNEVIQRIHMLIRDLRPEGPSTTTPKTNP